MKTNNVTHPVSAGLCDLDTLLLERAISKPANIVPPPPTENFLNRARRAAREAAELRMLAEAQKTMPFTGQPLPEYLKEISRRAGVSPVPSCVETASMQSFVSASISLAKSIGMKADRILLHVRIWLAEIHGKHRPVLSLARASQTAARPDGMPDFRGMPEIQILRWLEIMESEYDETARLDLQTAAQEVEAAHEPTDERF